MVGARMIATAQMFGREAGHHALPNSPLRPDNQRALISRYIYRRWCVACFGPTGKARDASAPTRA